jgi:hypothetical protein
MNYDNLIAVFQKQAKEWSTVHDALTNEYTVEFHDDVDRNELVFIANFNSFYCKKLAAHFQQNNEGDL